MLNAVSEMIQMEGVVEEKARGNVIGLTTPTKRASRFFMDKSQVWKRSKVAAQ